MDGEPRVARAVRILDRTAEKPDQFIPVFSMEYCAMQNIIPRASAALLGLSVSLANLAAPSTARADNYAYMGTGALSFGVVDLTTGVYAQCGVSSVQLSGLGVGPDHQLYGGAFRGTGFYSVNTTNGSLTLVGTSNVDFFDTGSTMTGVYAVDVNGELYSINVTTGAGTLVGPTGVTATGGGYWGLSTNSKSLYYSHQSTLYKLNLTSGRAKLVGTASAGIFGAEVMENRTLFAGSESPLAVYTLNTRNGSSTLLATLTGSGSGQFWGLAPIKATTISANKICAAHKI